MFQKGHPTYLPRVGMILQTNENVNSFQIFFQEFYQDFKFLFLLNFRFPRARIFHNIFFSSLHGSWLKYYTTTDQIGARGIIDTFHMFRVFKFARIFDKNVGHDAHQVKSP